MQTQTSLANRNLSLDLLRVLACLLVIWQHVTESYYIAADGSFTAAAYASTIAWIDSLSRASVPLFIMLSGYFLLPMRDDSASVFLKKRASRVLFPFLFWCVVYAAVRSGSITAFLTHIACIPVNWGVEVGHLWYVYMILGLYALIPVISPWVRSCGKGEMRAYLLLWSVTTLLPYVHLLWPEVLGECYWNPTPMLYHFTGLSGFLVLGSYVRKFGAPSRLASAALLIVGYAATAIVFCKRAECVTSVIDVELSWNFCTPNVAMMTLGLFGLVSSVKLNPSSRISLAIAKASAISYSVYLAHILVLHRVHSAIAPHVASVSLAIPLIAVTTFLLTLAAMAICSKLPKSHCWLGT